MQICWTKKAENNLDHIGNYIAKDNPSAAIMMELRISRCIELLSIHPNLGKVGQVTGTRELVIAGTPYIVAYRIQNDLIQILRVLHHALRWPENF